MSDTWTNAEYELVTLTCWNHHTGVPVLARTGDQLGAYCKTCTVWIKWVTQSLLWRKLETDQRAVGHIQVGASIAPASDQGPVTIDPSAPNDITSQEEAWIVAITEMATKVYADNELQGFHTRPRSTLERAALVMTELAELCEAARRSTLDQPSDHIAAYTNAEEEWADVLVRVFDHCQDDGVTPARLGQAFVAKLDFNRTRPYRHGGKTI